MERPHDEVRHRSEAERHTSRIRNIDKALTEFERSIASTAVKAHESLSFSVSDDPRLKHQANVALVHIARARLAAQSAAAVALASNASGENTQLSLGELGVVAGSAGHKELHRSIADVERLKEAHIRKRLAPKKSVERHPSVTSDISEPPTTTAADNDKDTYNQSVKSLAKLENAADRVLRAELAVTRRVVLAKQELQAATQREMRRAAGELATILLTKNETEKESEEEHSSEEEEGDGSARRGLIHKGRRAIRDNRPHIIDALVSGEATEIEAAFVVLSGPLVLYARHISNGWQLWPRCLLVLIGVGVLIDGQFSITEQCKSVINLGGYEFLPLSGWFVAQLFTDILIVLMRLHRFHTYTGVLKAFRTGAATEATQLRHKQRAELFSSFVKTKLSKVLRRKPPANHAGGGADASATHHNANTNRGKRGSVYARFRGTLMNRRRSQTRKEQEEEDHFHDMATPYALDAVVPIEEASERGEFAVMQLARIERSWTR